MFSDALFAMLMLRLGVLFGDALMQLSTLESNQKSLLVSNARNVVYLEKWSGCVCE